MQKILIDCRFSSAQAGLGRYTRELVTHLLKRDDPVSYHLLLRREHEDWLKAIDRSYTSTVVNIPHYSLAEQTTLPRLIQSSRSDLFFSPHFNVPLFCPIPFVVTIHDLILHHFGNGASLLRKVAYRTLMRNALRHAQSIIAVSRSVASELHDMYGSRIANKIRVVHEGVDAAFHPISSNEQLPSLSRYGIRKPFFLYVGNAKQHKNVPLLIRAFVESGRSDCELVLVCGGREALDLHPLPSGVRMVQGISDEDLPALYSAATACVTASLYEGFCLPVAEALACGTPVVAANRGAIAEIAQGHATLIEPTIDAFKEAFSTTYHPVQPFTVGTWEASAAHTWDLLRTSLSPT